MARQSVGFAAFVLATLPWVSAAADRTADPGAPASPASEPAPDAQSLWKRARALRESGRAAEALPLLQQAVAAGPATADMLVDLGVALSETGRLNEAEAAYRSALQATPGHLLALANLGSLAYQRGDMEESAALYGQVVARLPDNLIAQARLAHALRFLGRDEEAREHYGRALAIEPKTDRERRHRVDALVSLAILDLGAGDPGSAERSLAEVVRAAPDHPRAHYLRAQALYGLGRNAEAERELEVHFRLVSASQLPSVMRPTDRDPDPELPGDRRGDAP